jgi:hypothetical protein
MDMAIPSCVDSFEQPNIDFMIVDDLFTVQPSYGLALKWRNKDE